MNLREWRDGDVSTNTKREVCWTVMEIAVTVQGSRDPWLVRITESTMCGAWSLEKHEAVNRGSKKSVHKFCATPRPWGARTWAITMRMVASTALLHSHEGKERGRGGYSCVACLPRRSTFPTPNRAGCTCEKKKRQRPRGSRTMTDSILAVWSVGWATLPITKIISVRAPHYIHEPSTSQLERERYPHPWYPVFQRSILFQGHVR